MKKFILLFFFIINIVNSFAEENIDAEVIEAGLIGTEEFDLIENQEQRLEDNSFFLLEETERELGTDIEKQELVYNLNEEVKQSITDERVQKWAIKGQYLGILGKVGLEYNIYDRINLSLGYGLFFGKSYGGKERGVISDLYQISLGLQYNFTWSKLATTYDNGFFVRANINYNRYNGGPDKIDILVEENVIVKRNEAQITPALGAGYQFMWKSMILGLSAEYFAIGEYKVFTPITISAGVCF